MPAYLERMPAGIPGDVSRKGGATLEPNIVGSSPITHGAPVKLAAGKIAPLEAADAASVVYGFLARPYPMQSGADALGASQAPAGAPCDVLRRGYMTVSLKAGTAAKGGQVYVRIAVSGAKAVGDIEAAEVAAETVAVPGCVFMGPADAAGNTEIAYNI